MKITNSILLASVAAVAALSSSGASAFTTPSSKHSSSSSSQLQAFEGDFGAMAPLGYWDPLKLTTDGNAEYFDHLREVEVRHGRVSMLAVAGYLVTAAGVRLPGMENMPSGFKIFDADLIASLPREVRGTLPLTLGSVWFLTFLMQDRTGAAEFPGDYRNGIDMGWDKQTDEWKTKKRTIELNNGRAAQMGILGIMVHEQLGNLDAIGLPTP